MSAVIAWIATQAAGISWKAVGIGLAVIAVIGVIAGGYFYVSNLQDELGTTKAALTKETVLKLEERARADNIQVQHDAQIVRIDALEQQRTSISAEVMTLRKTIEDLDIEEDLASDDEDKATAAVTAFNTRNAGLNRLLERASRAGEVRPDPGAGSKARPSVPDSAIRRAFQALR